MAGDLTDYAFTDGDIINIPADETWSGVTPTTDWVDPEGIWGDEMARRR